MKVLKSGLWTVLMVLFVVSGVSAQTPSPNPADISVQTPDDYCGNMGTIKTISFDQIVIDGMNWDFESDQETVEETYAVDPAVKVALDGYQSYGDIKVGEFIGIECQKKNGRMIVTSIQSEEAINKSFGDIGDENAAEEDVAADQAVAASEAQPAVQPAAGATAQ